MPVNIPPKIPVPWATSGLKNTIPATSDPVTGNAGYDQGFTAINMTPRTAGGIPPFGQDFNGIFYAVTEALRYLETGAAFPYDSAFAAAVGGYPLGAVVQSADGTTRWVNTVANNTSDPAAFGAGWEPRGGNAATVAVSASNVTLTAQQAARQIIVLTGTLTANINVIFPTYSEWWWIVNRTTGAFAVTCKTATGGGISTTGGQSAALYRDGSGDLYPLSSTQFSTSAQNIAASAANVSVSPLGVRQALNATTGAGPLFACRAWVNFIGTGTVAIRGSGNVSSVSDDGTGLYTVNFITPMGDTFYAATASGIQAEPAVVGVNCVGVGTKTVTSCQVSTTGTTSGRSDFAQVELSVFR